MTVALVVADDIEVIPIRSRILPFHLGQARVIQNKHTFVHFIEIAPIVKQLNNIQHYYNIMNNTLMQVFFFPNRLYI